jgi:hypothetical protein
MKLRIGTVFLVSLILTWALPARAQDHGPVTTTKIFDEYESYYTLLLKRVGEMAAQGKSLDAIKKELKMPEYADWHGQDRLGINIDAAYKSVKK